MRIELESGETFDLLTETKLPTKCEVEDESFPTVLCSGTINGSAVAVEIDRAGRGYIQEGPPDLKDQVFYFEQDEGCSV